MEPQLARDLRRARQAAHLSQQSLANMAGLAQSHLSKIESGLDAQASVLQRVATALGFRLALVPIVPLATDPTPYVDEIANRMYLLGRVAAQRATAANLYVFRTWIESMRERQGDMPYYLDWLSIIERGPSEVASVFADPSEYGRYMRSVATFLPFVTKAERDSYFKPSLSAEALALAGAPV